MKSETQQNNIFLQFFRKYSYWYLLLYWLIYVVMFIFVERFYPVDLYHVIHSPLDDLIPFCEYFLIPYGMWYLFLVGIQVYTFFWEPEAFKRFIYFAALTYTAAIVVYLIYPNCQQMRPQEFVRDNFLTDIARTLYAVDTSTNVCPSIHVIGALGIQFASMDCRKLRTPGWQIFFWVWTVLISISTVFLKQHSVIDIAAAIPVSVIGYWIVYKWIPERNKYKRRAEA